MQIKKPRHCRGTYEIYTSVHIYKSVQTGTGLGLHQRMPENAAPLSRAQVTSISCTLPSSPISAIWPLGSSIIKRVTKPSTAVAAITIKKVE